MFRAIAGENNDHTFTSHGRERAVSGMLDAIPNFTPRNRPAFMHVFLANWLSHMSMADKIAGELGPDYIAVRTRRFFDKQGIRKLQSAQPNYRFLDVPYLICIDQREPLRTDHGARDR